MRIPYGAGTTPKGNEPSSGIFRMTMEGYIPWKSRIPYLSHSTHSPSSYLSNRYIKPVVTSPSNGSPKWKTLRMIVSSLGFSTSTIAQSDGTPISAPAASHQQLTHTNITATIEGDVCTPVEDQHI